MAAEKTRTNGCDQVTNSILFFGSESQELYYSEAILQSKTESAILGKRVSRTWNSEELH
jgi:hypothetical protein